METYKISVGPQLPGKIPAGSPYWGKFNGLFDNQNLTMPQLTTSIYTGCPITTWHSNQWRDRKNYICGQHLAVDFDTEDKRSEIKTLLSDPFVNKYASIIHTTPSHTIDAPRARVVFLLDAPIMQAKNYALAAASLLWLFSAADRQCKDPARFFYGAGVGAEIEVLPGILPLSTIRDMIKRYQHTGMQQKRTVTKYAARNADEQEVQDALKHINPWGIDYDIWIAILMAIHSEFPGGNGLAMAEAWGQGSEHEVERKWRSFDAGGNGGGKVGMGTLFGLAMERGYKKQ
ncbi:MAG: hypothetical protein GY938_16990 [Ketobacter sp.]|nr:hypothetical protein [Ketobacter sp.]